MSFHDAATPEDVPDLEQERRERTLAERTQCFVSDQDYRTHWGGEPQPTPAKAVWAGADRRNGHERRITSRRGEPARGRRFRLADRRAQ